MGANLNHDAGVVHHHQIEVHQRIHKLFLDVPLGEVVANLGQYHRLLRHRLHTAVVHDVLVHIVALGALRLLQAEVVDLGEVHLIYHLSFHLAGVELVVTFLVGIGLSLRTIGANNLHLGALDELHRLLVAHRTLDGVQQRGQLKLEEVQVGQRNLLALLVGVLVEGVFKRTVRGEISTLQHGVVVALGIVDNRHLVVRRVDRHTQVLRTRGNALANLGLKDIVAADAGQTVGREIKCRVATQDGERLTTGGVDYRTHIDGLAEVVCQRGTLNLPEVVVALATRHIGAEVERQSVAGDGGIEVVVHGVAQVDAHGVVPLAGSHILFRLLVLASFLAVLLRSLLGGFLLLVGGSLLHRSEDGATTCFTLNHFASGEIDGHTVGRETGLTFVA